MARIIHSGSDFDLWDEIRKVHEISPKVNLKALPDGEDLILQLRDDIKKLNYQVKDLRAELNDNVDKVDRVSTFYKARITQLEEKNDELEKQLKFVGARKGVRLR